MNAGGLQARPFLRSGLRAWSAPVANWRNFSVAVPASASDACAGSCPADGARRRKNQAFQASEAARAGEGCGVVWGI